MLLCSPDPAPVKMCSKEVSEMYPHLIPMAVYSSDCQSQGHSCLSIDLRHRLNTQGEISDRVPEIRKRTKASPATYQPSYGPPLHRTHVFQEESFWRKVCGTCLPSPPHAGALRQWQASWNVLLEGLIWIPDSLFYYQRDLVRSSSRSLDFLSAKGRGQGTTPRVAWITKSVDECENSSK